MHKSLVCLLCFLNLTILLCGAEYKAEDFTSRQAYDLNALFARRLSHLHKSFYKLDDESANSLVDVRFSGFNSDVESQQNGNSSFNSTCMNDVWFILRSIGEKQQWALRVIDSFGKPGSGIFQGNFKWMGDYNECVDIISTNPNSDVGNFRGKYCTLTWFPPDALGVPFHIPFTTGICVPDSCSNEELKSVVKLTHMGGSTFNDTQFDINATITCKATERKLSSPARGVIALLSILCALVILGSSITAAEHFEKIIKEARRKSIIVNSSECGQVVGAGSDTELTGVESGYLVQLKAFLGCFCIFTNGAKLLNTETSEGELLCIHGIRFLSMTWVILGHIYALPFGAVIRNQREVFKMADSFALQVILQAFFSVDSFFVLSGFLLTYLAMKEFAKNKGGISWPHFYIHRYVRLTPIYMIVLGFSASVYLYLGSGPFWPEPEGFIDKKCAENWWRNLLYINNFADGSKTCMGYSWYLANDMQFFVISPLFLITLWRWPKIGYSLIGIFLCATFLCNFLITYYYELTTGASTIVANPNVIDFTQAMAKYSEYEDKIYIKPYTRIGPYLIGILTGYLLFKRNASDSPKHNLTFLCIGWIVASSVTLTCVYGLYHNQPTVLAASFYNALSRNCFGAGLCWVIYVCLIGQGGVVNSILSYKQFIPLSRLTYTAYLIHPMILNTYFSSLKTSFEYSHPTMVILYLGFLIVIYGLSLPVALILESPIVSFEKLIRKTFKSK